MNDENWEKGFEPSEIEELCPFRAVSESVKQERIAEYEAWKAKEATIKEQRHNDEDLEWHREQQAFRNERDADRAMMHRSDW